MRRHMINIFTTAVSIGSSQKNRKSSLHDWKIANWNVKHQNKQKSPQLMAMLKYPVELEAKSSSILCVCVRAEKALVRLHI